MPKPQLDEFLEHYGVKGMKWGESKADKSGGDSGNGGPKLDDVNYVPGAEGGGGGMFLEDNGETEEDKLKAQYEEWLATLTPEQKILYTANMTQVALTSNFKDLNLRDLAGSEWVDDPESFPHQFVDTMAGFQGKSPPTRSEKLENHVATRRVVQNALDTALAWAAPDTSYQGKTVVTSMEDWDRNEEFIGEVLSGGGKVRLRNANDG